MARANQSVAPPGPLVRVTVTEDPAGMLVALTARVGVLLMVKVSEFEVPPPGAGLTTRTCAVPEDAMSLTGIVRW